MMMPHRLICSSCDARGDAAGVECAAVPSNVRAFKHETFHVWRCPQCRSLHCREVVDPQRYYENYPIPRTLSAPLRLTYANVLDGLTAHGYTSDSALLDYGCGHGLFLQFLRERGHANGAGYDPYSSVAAFHSRAPLRPAAFDYVLLMDVIEHVEDPRALLREIDQYLKPGGRVFVGTPRADGISLKQPMKFWLQLHPPYHLHIYTRRALAELGADVGWAEAGFFDRPYYDTRIVGLNARAITRYSWFTDGTLDSFLDAVPAQTQRRSVPYLFACYFGYWFKRTCEMAMVFRKPLESAPGAHAQAPARQ